MTRKIVPDPATATAHSIALEPVVAELETFGVFDDLAAIAQRHRVTISVTLAPYVADIDEEIVDPLPRA